MRVSNAVGKVIKSMEWIGVVGLLLTMFITASDVVMGMFRQPILGAYDLAGIGSGIAISFSIAVTSWKKQHIRVDTFTQRFPPRFEAFWNAVLRIINGALFALLSLYVFKLSCDFKQTGEVCASLPTLPLWPIVFALGCACTVQCLVSIAELMSIERKGESHE